MKDFLISVILFLITNFTFSQALTGTLTIGSDPLDDYSSIATAVNSLNTNGVAPGGVIFEVSAGHAESINSAISMSIGGSGGSPVVFQKSGVGANPIITAYTGTFTPSSATQDGIWNLKGCDYVTIDGIDLFDPNSTNPATMEYGFGLFKASTTDGCRNNIIKNCVITLSRENNEAGAGIMLAGSKGIQMLNATLADQTTEIIPANQAGTNSYNIFINNTIQECNYGVFVYGFNAGNLYIDQGDIYNEIGGLTTGTGNTILNFGGATGAIQDAAGIYSRSQYFHIIGKNFLNNNSGGANHTSNLRGIVMASNTGVFNQIVENSISLQGGGTSSIVTGILSSTAGGNSGDIYITNNLITADYLSATTGNLWGIANIFAATSIHITGNTISNFNYSQSSLSGSGLVYPIYNIAAVTNVNITGNIISSIHRTGTSGNSSIGIYSTSGTNQTINGNTIYDFNTGGSGLDGAIIGIQTNTGAVVVNDNIIHTLHSDIDYVLGIYNTGNPTSESYNNNIIYDLSNVNGWLKGIYSTPSTMGLKTVANNQVYNLTGSGNDISGIYLYNGSSNVYQNKIYGIQSTSMNWPTVSGIDLAAVSSNGTSNIYNNLIGNIVASSASSMDPSMPSVIGLNVTAPQLNTNTSINVSYNTVHLNASSSGSDFSTAAFYSVTGTDCSLKVRNNLLINNSIASGTGLCVSYQRSSSSLSDYDNSSNYNSFYAGAPSTANLLFYDGTNFIQTLTSLQTLLAPRESVSITENPTFKSLTGSSSNFLHLNESVSTLIDNGGVVISGVLTDFDGDTRNASTPDMGADEFTANFSWTGATDTDWNTASNWSWNDVPLATSNVSIPNVTNNPVINEPVSLPAVCNNLTIELGGVLTINANKALTINGTLTNNAGNFALFVQSTAEGTGSLLHNTNNVNGTIEQFITGNTNTNETFDYHLVSIPLNSVTTAAQYNGMFLFNFEPISQQWGNTGSDPSTILNSHQGYMLFSPLLNTSIYYSGLLVSGSFTALTPINSGEYCLVPNPYPSAINWDAASGWTKTGIQDAFYIWNPVSNNYVTWSDGAGTALTANIPVGQSFFVKANAASPVLSMTNAVRAHSTQAFWKNTESSVPEVFHLNVSDNESADEMIVRFNNEATADRGFLVVDKLYGADIAPQLYSLTPNADKLTINALDHSTQTIVVPVGIEYFESNSLTFTASGIESFESSVSIFLEDKLLNKTIDLRENPVYTFTNTIGTDPTRFNLLFYGVNGTHELNTVDNYNIWVSGDQINILIPDHIGQKAMVEIIDQQGRLLESQQLTLDQPSYLRSPNSAGVYVVKVLTGNQAFTSKVFIR